jgi:hypothetical protein
MMKDEPAPELDAEQLALCQDAEFWKMIAQRRQEPRISREELEQQLADES